MVASVAHFVKHLAGNYDLVALALKCFAKHSFRDPGVVQVRSIKEVDAGIEAALNDLVRARLVERLAQCHRAETETGDSEVGVVQRALLSAHGVPSSRSFMPC